MPVLRSVKNIVKNYTDAEVKVREATSNDPWGPSSTLMSEIADLTYNVVAFTEIMAMIWKRLSDHGKNWRHVYKSLTLLEYIMKTGSDKVAQQCKENIFAIQTLSDFQHMEDNRDLGSNVREKAKVLMALLKDDERLKNERAKALKAKERFTENFGIGSDSTSTQLGKPKHRPAYPSTETHKPNTLANPEYEDARPHSVGEEELQLQLALAMSKEEADNDAKKKTNDDLKLQMALEESRKEDEAKTTATKDEHLLDFAGGGILAGPPAANDPWNATTVPTVQVTSDPWFTGPGSAAANPSPFSPPISSSDPWASTSTAVPAPTASSNNPWDPQPTAVPTAASTVASSDPWSTDTPAANNSPWESNGTNTQKPHTVDDDFDVLGSRAAPTSQPVSDKNGGDLFDMQNVSSSLPPLQHGQVSLVADPKKPDDFLAPEAKTLVNLDSLITKPATSTGVVNPFAMTSAGVAPSVNNNPFAAQQPPPPSLNQMSANTTGFSNGAPQMAPMMPMGGGYPGVPPQQPMFQSQQPPMHNMNNPFL